MFYIRNCNGDIVGNPNGYRTHKGAQRQAEMRTSKAYAQIWHDFYASETSENKKENRLIYSITHTE